MSLTLARPPQRTTIDADLSIKRLDGPRDIIYEAPGFHYQVKQLDSNKNPIRGHADLALYTVESLTNRPRYHSELVSRQFFNRDIVAEIANFYPHGNKTEGREGVLFRKGVGSVLFETMQEDARNSGARAIILHASTDEMRNFVEKKGFQPIEGAKHFYLKEI